MFKETSPIDIVAVIASDLDDADFSHHAQPCAGAQICSDNHTPYPTPSSNYEAKDSPHKNSIEDDLYTGEKTTLQIRGGRLVSIRQLDIVHTPPRSCSSRCTFFFCKNTYTH